MLKSCELVPCLWNARLTIGSRTFCFVEVQRLLTWCFTSVHYYSWQNCFNKNQPQGYLFFFLSAVQTSGAVHVLPQTSVRFPTENPRLLWAPLPGQDVWWRKHPGGTERAAQRGELVFGYLCVCKGLSMSVNICGKKKLPEGPAVVTELSETIKPRWTGNSFQTNLCHSKQLNLLCEWLAAFTVMLFKRA